MKQAYNLLPLSAVCKVEIESLGSPMMNSANVAAVQSAMFAQILTAEEMNIRVEGGSIFKFTFEVTPRIGEPFRAETQAATSDSSREKYSVGTVYVCYDPANKAQVALDRTF